MDTVRNDVRVLLVGPPGETESLGRLLSPTGGRIVATTVPPGDALAAVRQHSPDSVVVSSPRSGPALIETVRESFPDLPVFLVAADGAAADAGLDAGATDYVRTDGGSVERILADRITNAVVRRRSDRTAPGPGDGADGEVPDDDRFNEDLRRLYAISSNQDTDFETKVDRLLELGCERFGLNVGFLSAIERTFEVVAARGDHPKIHDRAESPLWETYCRKTIETDEALTVENAPEEGWIDDPAFEKYDLSCYVGAKVTVEGDLYGTLCFADGHRTRTFTDADVTLVDLMAGWVGYEIERKHHVQALRAQNERFEELARALSHDLGNLLEVARGHVEYTLSSGDLDRLEEAKDAHDRAAALLRHTVTLTRAGRRIDETAPVDLRSIATEAWTHVDRSGEGLVVDLPTDQRVMADRERLLQLLENLFRNAIEHGGERVTVRVGDLDDGFFVADDGEGIPPDDRAAVFDSGVSESPDGSGLGLSIVDQIATAHGWSVGVHESDDGGARFDVTGVSFEGPPPSTPE